MMIVIDRNPKMGLSPHIVAFDKWIYHFKIGL